MARYEIDGIFKHAPLTEDQIGASQNRNLDREIAINTDFADGTPFPANLGSDSGLVNYILSYTYDNGSEVIRRNIPSLELLSNTSNTGTTNDKAGADWIKVEAKSYNYISSGESVQTALEELDAAIQATSGGTIANIKDGGTTGSLYSLGGIAPTGTAQYQINLGLANGLADSAYSTILNGAANTVNTSTYSGVLGGSNNFIESSTRSVICSGMSGYIQGGYNAIVSGTSGYISGDNNIIGSSDDGTIIGGYSGILCGSTHYIYGVNMSLVSGAQNTAVGGNGSIVSGVNNRIGFKSSITNIARVTNVITVTVSNALPNTIIDGDSVDILGTVNFDGTYTILSIGYTTNPGVPCTSFTISDSGVDISESSTGSIYLKAYSEFIGTGAYNYIYGNDQSWNNSIVSGQYNTIKGSIDSSVLTAKSSYIDTSYRCSILSGENNYINRFVFDGTILTGIGNSIGSSSYVPTIGFDSTDINTTNNTINVGANIIEYGVGSIIVITNPNGGSLPSPLTTGTKYRVCYVDNASQTIKLSSGYSGNPNGYAGELRTSIASSIIDITTTGDPGYTWYISSIQSNICVSGIGNLSAGIDGGSVNNALIYGYGNLTGPVGGGLAESITMIGTSNIINGAVTNIYNAHVIGYNNVINTHHSTPNQPSYLYDAFIIGANNNIGSTVDPNTTSVSAAILGSYGSKITGSPLYYTTITGGAYNYIIGNQAAGGYINNITDSYYSHIGDYYDTTYIAVNSIIGCDRCILPAVIASNHNSIVGSAYSSIIGGSYNVINGGNLNHIGFNPLVLTADNIYKKPYVFRLETADFNDGANTLTITGVSLDNGTPVFLHFNDASLITGLDNTTQYYVVNSSSPTFQLSLSYGGPAIDFTNGGAFGPVILYTATNVTTGSTISGGVRNQSAADYSTIVGGYGAVTDNYGQMAHASGYITHLGDAQKSTIILRKTTSSAAPTILRVDGGSTAATLRSGAAWSGTINVVGSQTGGNAISRLYRFVAKNNGGTVTVNSAALGTDPSDIGAGLGYPTIAISGSTNELRVTVTAANSTATTWVAVVEYVQTIVI